MQKKKEEKEEEDDDYEDEVTLEQETSRSSADNDEGEGRMEASESENDDEREESSEDYYEHTEWEGDTSPDLDEPLPDLSNLTPTQWRNLVALVRDTSYPFFLHSLYSPCPLLHLPLPPTLLLSLIP